MGFHGSKDRARFDCAGASGIIRCADLSPNSAIAGSANLQIEYPADLKIITGRNHCRYEAFLWLKRTQ
jgi:hypothetical protein